jgi:hypothetical protein
MFLLSWARSLIREESHYNKFITNLNQTFTFKTTSGSGTWMFYYTKELDKLPKESIVKRQLLDLLAACDDCEDDDDLAENCLELAIDKGYIEFTRNRVHYWS